MWEVRHGSIMALREILTHHGSCAGVLSPDLSSEKFWFVDTSESTKRGRDIDLNMQLEADQLEPALKRQKSSHGAAVSNHYMGTDDKTDVEMEGEPCNEITNGSLGSAHIKLEPDLFTDSFRPQCKAEDTSPVEASNESGCILDMNVSVECSQSSKLMKLVTVARQSWIKNWDFLQDSAIKSLCILSLDRYVSASR